METKEKEITDEMLAMKEEEFFGFVETSLDPTPSSERRIDSIIKRAQFETVARDSADFVAEGVTKGLLGVLDTMMCLGNGEDPKRNY